MRPLNKIKRCHVSICLEVVFDHIIEWTSYILKIVANGFESRLTHKLLACREMTGVGLFQVSHTAFFHLITA